MQRKKIIAANWKMNGTEASIATLLKAIRSFLTKAQIIIFPPFVFLPQVQRALQGSSISWGGQNHAIAQQGALTGEISASMLREFGCRYSLVGHSERRSLYHEDNAIVAIKFQQAQLEGLMPILCVGETLAEHEARQTLDVIWQQIIAVIDKIDIDAFQSAVIAYEPVWAIGTGKTATPEQVQEVHQQIRERLAQKHATIANHLPILYGGSVKIDNAASLLAMPDIDGALVGGASLQAKQFEQICLAYS